MLKHSIPPVEKPSLPAHKRSVEVERKASSSSTSSHGKPHPARR